MGHFILKKNIFLLSPQMIERLKSVVPRGTKQMNLADVSSSEGCCSMLYKYQPKAPQDLECIDQGCVGVVT